MVHKRFRVFDRTLDGVTVVRSFFFLVIRFGCYRIYSYSMYIDTKPIFRATVFRALDPNGRTVALKVLTSSDPRSKRILLEKSLYGKF